MKILHVSKKYPNALGGDAVVVANLQREQETAGHQVAILTSNCTEIRRGPHIYRFGLRDTPVALDTITLKRLVSLCLLLCKASWVLLRERPALIHTHSVDLAFVVSLPARLLRIPIIHTFHIVTFYDETQPAIRRKTELVLARLAHAAIITAPNQHDVSILQAHGFNQAVLLPNGVDTTFWRPVVKSQHDAFVFVAVGRIEPQKGYQYLVEAAALLQQTAHRAFRVIVVGTGSQSAQLEELVDTLGLQDTVELVGRKSPDEIRDLLAHADAAVIPSFYESTPLTLLEAWASAVPVIMTPVGLLHDASDKTGLVYLVEPGVRSSLVRAMQQCMDDEAGRQAIATSGHNEVAKYAWPTIGQTVGDIYRGVM